MDRRRHLVFVAVYVVVALIGLVATTQNDDVDERGAGYLVEGRDAATVVAALEAAGANKRTVRA